MDEPASERPSSGGGAYALFLFIGLALYPLSLGPAALMYDHLPRAGKRALRVMYAPLEHLEHTPLARPIEQYVDLWRRH